ncbi:MAG: glutathione peroxidase, partial [Shewanella sp.]|nr:glutathione peroxidase [Shewanella sp.]
MATPFYELTATNINGEDIALNNFQDKVLLIVNTASGCGFTPQYKGLEALYQKYETDGFTVLGFPCNQFGKQEKGSEQEIASFCELNF